MQKQLLEKENNLGGLTMKKFLKQLLNKRLNNEKGLTLIELLAVIVILAIVAAIAVPAIGNIIGNSQIKATKADALNILNAANLYVTENPNTTEITYTASTATYSPTNFSSFIQSLGSFSEVDFTVNIDSTTKAVTITAESVGERPMNFNDAGIDDIEADDADDDGTAVEVL